jgi:hypothetical protein
MKLISTIFRLAFAANAIALIAGCVTTDIKIDSTAQPEPAGIVSLSIEKGAINALAYDLDQDGLKDIIATSHGGDRALVFRQIKPRVFALTQVLTEVGFHPNNFDIWPSEQGRYLLNNAEGRNKIQTYSVDSTGRLSQVHEMPAGQPRMSAAFVSKRYGPSLLTVPYGGGSLDLFLGFDPLSGAQKHQSVDISGMQEQVLLADFNQDGKIEALVPAKLADQLWLVDDLEGDVPKKRLLKQFGPVTGPVNAAISDFNADGVPDIIVGLAISRDIVRMVGDGGGKFHETAPLGFSPNMNENLTRLVAGVDKGGESYLAVGGINIVKLYHYTAGASAPDADWPFVGGRVDGIVTGLTLTDLDNDGLLDLVISKTAGPDYKNGVAIVFGPLLENLPKLQQKP